MHNEHPAMPPAQTEPKKFFEMIAPKTAYWLGVGTGLGVVLAIGFFVLLNLYLKQGGFKTSPPPPVVVAPTPVAPTANNTPPAPANIQIAAVTDADHIRGGKDAKVTIVEYSDLECPFCKRFHPTMKQVVATYGDKVKWVYRHFPLDSLHPKTRNEAHATECAAEQGGNDAFWKYTDRIYEITPSNNGLDPAQLPQIAKEIGLDVKKFEECQKSNKFTKKIQEQSNDAVAAGGQGTPYSVILAGDQKIPMNGALPFEQIKPVLDSLLK